jgi:hypothetical protein
LLIAAISHPRSRYEKAAGLILSAAKSRRDQNAGCPRKEYIKTPLSAQMAAD